MKLNDIIIHKCASQYGKCYVNEIKIDYANFDFVYKDNKTNDKNK